MGTGCGAAVSSFRAIRHVNNHQEPESEDGSNLDSIPRATELFSWHDALGLELRLRSAGLTLHIM